MSIGNNIFMANILIYPKSIFVLCFIWQHSSIFDNFILDVANSILFILKISAKFMISRFCRRKICTYVDMYYAVVDK